MSAEAAIWESAFARQFEQVARSPHGIARLRELITTLAIQGKLVPQDPSERSAADLLKAIAEEVDRQAANGHVTRVKPMLELGDPCPFEIPESWAWVPMGQVVEIVRGITFPASEKTRMAMPGRIACLRTANVQATVEWDDLLFVDRKFVGREDQLLKLHDIVMSMANSRELVGKVALVDHIPHEEASFGGFLGVLRPRLVEPRYVMALLRAPYARSSLVESSSQTTNIANISLGKLRPLPFPLPPLAEQARIVARVEELMRLCDALEAKGRLEAEQHARLLSTLLGTLTESRSSEELATNWQRVATHFDLLLDRPEAVDALEQTVLQLAVRGLLVSQDQGDEPASKLLESVASVKGKRAASGRAQRSRPTSSAAAVSEPFPLPVGWQWSRLPELCEINGGSTPSKAVASYWSGNIPWVSPKDMKVAAIEDAQDHVSADALIGSLSLIPSGSLLMVVRGMILAHSFPVASTKVEVTINQDMKALTPYDARLLPFLMLACVGMKAEVLQLVDRSTHGTCKLESSKIFGLPIPVPPIAEQARIVARVTELRRLCTDLRQRLIAQQATQTQLAEALVAAI